MWCDLRAEDHANCAAKCLNFTWYGKTHGFFNQCWILRALHPGASWAIWRGVLWCEGKDCSRKGQDHSRLKTIQRPFKTIQDHSRPMVKAVESLDLPYLPVIASLCIAPLHIRLACYHHVTAISGLDWFDHVHQHGALHSGTCRIVNDRCAPSLQTSLLFGSFKGLSDAYESKCLSRLSFLSLVHSRHAARWGNTCSAFSN